MTDLDAKRKALDAVPLEIPKGAPSWVTVELIESTLKTWQPYYSYRLTAQDAVVMIKSAARLFDVMSCGSGGDETVRCVGSR